MKNFFHFLKGSKAPLVIALIQVVLYSALWIRWYGHSSLGSSTTHVLTLTIYFFLNVAIIRHIYQPMISSKVSLGNLKTLVKCLGCSLFISIVMKVLPVSLMLLVRNPEKLLSIFSILSRSLQAVPLLMSVVSLLLFQYLTLYLLRNPVSSAEKEAPSEMPPPAKIIGKPVTYKIILFLAIFIGLQFTPQGSILITMFGMGLLGPHGWGLLPHLVTVGLLADIVTRRLPSVLILVPLLIYGGYYALYGLESISIKRVEAELQAKNPPQILAYDSDKMSLVSPAEDAASRASYLKIPVLYSPADVPEGYSSYRIATKELCNVYKTMQSPRSGWFHTVNWMPKGSLIRKQLPLCVISRPEIPPHEIISVSSSHKASRIKGLNIQQEIYSFSYGGREIGSFETARYARLPPFPFFMVGYIPKFPGASGGGFYAGIYRGRATPLDVFPPAVNKAGGGNVVASMLGIDVYKEEDLDNFKDYPQTVALVNSVAELQRGNPAAVLKERYSSIDINKKLEGGETLLMRAVEKRNVEEVRALLDSGAGLNIIDDLGETALIKSTKSTEIATILIERGADIGISSNKGLTALISATIAGNADFVRLLLDKGASPNEPPAYQSKHPGSYASALLAASFHGHAELAKLLIEHGADVNASNKNGQTPLMISAIRGHGEIVGLLVTKGANINAQSSSGETALNYSRRPEIANLLLENGATKKDLSSVHRLGEKRFTVAVPHNPACILVAACIDRDAIFEVKDAVLRHESTSVAKIGTYEGCPAEMKFENGGYLVKGGFADPEKPQPIGIGLGSFRLVKGRGSVSSIDSNTFKVEDRAGGAAGYEIDLCPPGVPTAAFASPLP